ncbi:hypothetical protein C8J43_102971 [Sphingomonas sp. PP-CE-1G-424]|nr:hypothetical protein C8J43_102971 [Sphingomonas sp. PP-CE-1G-424]
MIHAKPVLSEAERAQRRDEFEKDEFEKKVFRAEAQRRGDGALAAQRLSRSPAEKDLMAAYAETVPKHFSSASLRLCAKHLILFAPSRLRVNQSFSGTSHV